MPSGARKSDDTHVAEAIEDKAYEDEQTENPRRNVRGSRTMQKTRAFRRQRDIHGLSKISEEVIEQIASSLSHGNYIESAAAYAGVSKKTLYTWMRRGREEIKRVEQDARRKVQRSEELYVDFLNAVELAQAEAADRDLRVVSFAADYLGDWRAAAWRRERADPGHWGRHEHQTVEHSGSGGGPLEFVTVTQQDRAREDGDVGDSDNEGVGE